MRRIRGSQLPANWAMLNRSGLDSTWAFQFWRPQEREKGGPSIFCEIQAKLSQNAYCGFIIANKNFFQKPWRKEKRRIWVKETAGRYGLKRLLMQSVVSRGTCA